MSGVFTITINPRFAGPWPDPRPDPAPVTGEVYSHGLDLPEVLLRCATLMRSRSAKDGIMDSILVAEVATGRVVLHAVQKDGSWHTGDLAPAAGASER